LFLEPAAQDDSDVLAVRSIEHVSGQSSLPGSNLRRGTRRRFGRPAREGRRKQISCLLWALLYACCVLRITCYTHYAG
jgi:hypothetical protein